jgi:predicted GIY-YIG superfamily endonuclease|tara:strand:+ start:356 stop:889 length:534 start_codon:yes stop_codon:yes gene_type:complete
MKKKRKKYILSEEAKAKRKIYMAEWRKNNSDYQKNHPLTEEQKAKYKAKKKITDAKWYRDNREEQLRYKREWHKKNPDWISPIEIENPNYLKEQASRHNLGYWVVYLIKNYNGLGDTYCGQTQNIPNRMRDHKCRGRLNTDNYELIKQCETLEDALEFENYMHEQGYHGNQRTESGK